MILRFLAVSTPVGDWKKRSTKECLPNKETGIVYEFKEVMLFFVANAIDIVIFDEETGNNAADHNNPLSWSYG